MLINDEQLIHLFYEVARKNKYTRLTQNKEIVYNLGQYQCMYALDQVEKITQGELAKKLAIQPGSLSELLKKLEAKHFIQRTPGEEDRRVIWITLTSLGKEEVQKNYAIRRQLQGEILLGLSEEEKEQFFLILSKIKTNLDKESEG